MVSYQESNHQNISSRLRLFPVFVLVWDSCGLLYWLYMALKDQVLTKQFEPINTEINNSGKSFYLGWFSSLYIAKMGKRVVVYTDQYLHVSKLLRNNLNITLLQRIMSQNKFIKIQLI